MGISVTDILKMSGMIMMAVPPAAAFAPIAGGIAAVLEGAGDDDGPDEVEWKQSRVHSWMELAKDLMGIPMSNEIRSRTLEGKLRSDFFKHFAEMPKDRWVEKLHADIVMAVKGDMAASGG